MLGIQEGVNYVICITGTMARALWRGHYGAGNLPNLTAYPGSCFRSNFLPKQRGISTDEGGALGDKLNSRMALEARLVADQPDIDWG